LLFNTKKVLPGKSKPFYLWPAKMEMYFLPPESVQPGDTVASLKERVFTIMYAFAREHRG
jgi:hypothetical protein